MRKLLAGAAVLALTVTVHAQSQMPNTSGGAPNPLAQGAQTQGQNQKVSAATKQFVQKAAITDLFEIQTGQLAQQKADIDDYKEFGQMIVNDHQQASGQLKSIAQNIQGVEVPTALDSAHQQKMSEAAVAVGRPVRDPVQERPGRRPPAGGQALPGLFALRRQSRTQAVRATDLCRNCRST